MESGKIGVSDTKEQQRLSEARESGIPWKKWGPYLSERQWGTVREDENADGSSWAAFTHDQARSRAYHWGEDGIAGISDDKQRLCFSMVFWNGKDPILDERIFGLDNSEGNHGEDVKEYYFYLDNTPTHSYMKYLFKYSHHAYPYDQMVSTNRRRNRTESEYELLDTGIFDKDEYFDIFIEYAKESPEEILVRVTAINRGKDTAELHLLPTLWFRNTWYASPHDVKPLLKHTGRNTIHAAHPELGSFYMISNDKPELLFSDNETNTFRLRGIPNAVPFVKDGINDYVVHGKKNAVNPAQEGTKASSHYHFKIKGRQSATIKLRLGRQEALDPVAELGKKFDSVFEARIAEANEFYDSVIPSSLNADEKNVMRQAYAGMLWSKQYYYFDLEKWLKERKAHPLQGLTKLKARNQTWYHMVNDDIISMPDKWEYPWYAAWDLAFHTVVFSGIDIDFAKQQLELLLQQNYMHPNGQIPAYEWNFSDVNPPVHAWAAIYIYYAEKTMHGREDRNFLKRVFHKLSFYFTWWINRKDYTGNNLFEGGFLGLDNIGVFDRSSPLPTGGRLEQSDGTAWMILFSSQMLEIATILALDDDLYEDLAQKYLEHYLWITYSLNGRENPSESMWDEADGFFYDVLRLPDGSATRLKLRSMVGLLPFCAVSVFEKEVRERIPRLPARTQVFMKDHPDFRIFQRTEGCHDRRLLAVTDETQMRRILFRLLDEKEFLSPYGIRSLSKIHAEHPYVFKANGHDHRVAYLPAESDSGMFGGNSNWRGPVWFPMNIMLIRALLHYYAFYGDRFKVECPTGSGKEMTLFEVAKEIGDRLARIFLKDAKGRRPVYGLTEKFQTDPHWKDLILFYEYFHGDNGAGIGASHQTGWTGLVATLMQTFASLKPTDLDSNFRDVAYVVGKTLKK
jgi:hypothetical protein